MTTNEVTYKEYTVLSKLTLETVRIVACDLESAKADFNEAFGIENAVGPWYQIGGWSK